MLDIPPRACMVAWMKDTHTPMVVNKSVRDAVASFRAEILNLALSTKSIGLGSCITVMLKIMDLHRKGQPFPGKEWFALEIKAMPVRGRPAKKPKGPANPGVPFDDFAKGARQWSQEERDNHGR